MTAQDFIQKQIGRLWLRVCELEYEVASLRAASSTPPANHLVKADNEKE